MANDVWSLIRKSNSVIGDIMLNDEDVQAGIDRKNKKYKSHNIKKSIERLKFCEECRMVWELETGNNHRKIKLVRRYSELPSYKKPRKTCPVCLGDVRYEE